MFGMHSVHIHKYFYFPPSQSDSAVNMKYIGERCSQGIKKKKKKKSSCCTINQRDYIALSGRNCNVLYFITL